MRRQRCRRSSLSTKLKRPAPGRKRRYEFEYIRHGTQTRIASPDIHTGLVLAWCGAGPRADDLVGFMQTVGQHYRSAQKMIDAEMRTRKPVAL